MGYLEQATCDIADFSQAVISMWFRIPQASIDAAVAQYEAITVTSGSLEDGNLPGMIPLLTFGIPSAITNAVPETTSRCFIGVSCGHRYGQDIADELEIQPPRMFVYLQYDSGSIGYPFDIDAFDFFQIGGAPVLFSSVLGATDRPDGGSIEVTADEWHHILISFDMTGGCETSIIEDDFPVSFDNACQFWWAYDDVNYNGDYLWPSNPNSHPGYSGGNNDIYSAGCLAIVDETRTFAAGNLPVEGNPMGIPVSADDVSHGYNMMRAEIQIYTGVTLDTSDEANRRAFIKENGRPEAKSAAATLLGKEPEVYFVNDDAWQSGTNSGTGGNFTKTGTINDFSPPP